MYDLIEKKKHKVSLTEDEISWMVRSYTQGEIPDYQMSAFLMAVWFQGMTDEELTWLTLSMADSGDRLDLSGIDGVKMDKHSTGGVGDKTTLVVTPVLAALGVPTAKMSGRGLGFTGGTVDKIESVPGARSELSEEEFIRVLRAVGFVDVAQTREIAPADKLLYALRDVTATVDSIPLIASSIMSKKLAAGADRIALDVKCGSGAFMPEQSSAEALADQMIRIGTMAGKRVIALITDMDQPLGCAVGNLLEVWEAIEVLSGGGEERLRELCIRLSVEMLLLSDRFSGTEEEAEAAVEQVLSSGQALERFLHFLREVGGDPSCLFEGTDRTKPADPEQVLRSISPGLIREEICMEKSGYLTSCDTKEVGMVSVMLGAGRKNKEDVIDPAAGILLKKKLGDHVEKGETVAVFYTNLPEVLPDAKTRFCNAYTVEDSKPEETPVIRRILR